MKTSILWFRRDFRLTDNPALLASLRDAKNLIPIYLHAPDEERPWIPGAASNWWLHQSLSALDENLRLLGSQLIIAKGRSHTTLKKLALSNNCTEIFFNRLPEPVIKKRDEKVVQHLQKAGINCHAYNATRLTEELPLKRSTGTPYRVFTPFWRALLKQGLPTRNPLPAPKTLPPLPDAIDSVALNSLRLLPGIPWYDNFQAHWEPGEQGAFKQLKLFLDHSIDGYADARDRPDLSDTSRLSPYLHFGEISPLQILRGVEARTGDDITNPNMSGPSEYLRQLAGWREFALYLLDHFPDTDQSPFDPRFNNYRWRQGKAAEKLLHCWQKGKTGIPIIDAGMRELWQSGWIHNRVRMITASYLTKNLAIHWLQGARWFWDTLVDADCANNAFGWQWSAGCGADAAPYFRIFNPVRQAQRFDPHGDYIRRWIPELALLSNKYLSAPWEAPSSELLKAGIRLGKTYPKPIVDLQASRKDALLRWDRVKHYNSIGSALK